MNVSFLPRILHEILRPGIVPSVGRGRLGGGRGGDMLLGTRRRWPDETETSYNLTTGLWGHRSQRQREHDQHRHVRRRPGAGGKPGQGVRCPGVRGLPQENTRQVCTQGKFSLNILLVLTVFRVTWFDFFKNVNQIKLIFDFSRNYGIISD